jgi:hypothetical protein
VCDELLIFGTNQQFATHTLSGAIPAVRSERRTRTALSLEAIALRHQIALLERSRTRRPCFRRIDRLFWMLLSRWWQVGTKARWSFSLIQSCVGAVRTGLRFGDIDRTAAGEVDVLGFPVRFAI